MIIVASIRVYISRESGLFHVWTKQIYEMNKIKEETDRDFNKDEFKYNDQSLDSVEDIFELISYSFCVVLIVFVRNLVAVGRIRIVPGPSDLSSTQSTRVVR